MRRTLEKSKLFPYIAAIAIVLFLIFIYHLGGTLKENVQPLGDKMDAKMDFINSIKKGE